MSHNESYRGYDLECALSFDGAKRPAGTWLGVARYRRNGARLFNAMSFTISARNARTARLRMRALARDNIDKLADRILRNIEKYGMQDDPACQKKPRGRIVVIEHINGLYRVNITFGYRTVLDADCDLSLVAFFRTARAAEIEGIVWAKELMSEDAKADSISIRSRLDSRVAAALLPTRRNAALEPT